ncbi:MAG: oligoribonuclease [Patescibacteria group bacterium]|nr:oligoribonuclease [Patescibacteria group bacterium]
MDKKLINERSDRILWLDLEMTGLSSDDDLILEVAAIVTDWDFNELASYHGIVKNDVKILNDRLAVNSAFWDVNAETRSNLVNQNQEGKPLLEIEDEILSFIDDHFKKGLPVLLGGNSIHMDRRFIVAKWPRFDKRLHYRMLDVSAWKVVFEGKYKKRFNKPDEHRALSDIRGSIMELQYYLSNLK